MQEASHIKEITQTCLGGVCIAGTTHAAFDITDATQYATFAAAVATTIYFIVMTYIAIVNRNKNAGN